MNKLLYILATILTFSFAACGNDEEPTQDYTSFVVTIDDSNTFINCIAAYEKDNKFYKISDLGSLTRGKYSNEIILNNNDVLDIYIFAEYGRISRFDAVYHLTKNKKNTIVVSYGTSGITITDKTDQSQYPQ